MDYVFDRSPANWTGLDLFSLELLAAVIAQTHMTTWIDSNILFKVHADAAFVHAILICLMSNNIPISLKFRRTDLLYILIALFRVFKLENVIGK
jgi:hypothetical protein